MSDEPQLFLLGQTVSALAGESPAQLLGALSRKRISPNSGEAEIKEEWKNYPRADLIADAAKQDATRRVALVSSAGLGKSTNMGFVEAHVAGEPGGKQLPFLIRLDRTPKNESASHIEMLTNAVKDPDALLDWLALRVTLATGADKARNRWAIERLVAAGRVTLLLDGLDHVMDRKGFLRDLADLLNGVPWRNCPVWISGRREAFEKWGEAFFDGYPLRVLQVDPLGPDEVDICTRAKTGYPWQHDFPPECRQLLATPRTLGLICYTLRMQIPHPPAGRQTRQEAIRRLDLHTTAGIYYRAYFHIGPDGAGLDSHGLLAQGLLADKENLGLPGRKPLHGNLPKRVERMGLVLGAIAFHMIAEGAEEIGLQKLHRNVGPKLERLGLGTADDFEEHLELLRGMDNHTLEFSLFNSDFSTGRLSWDNRTVKAFFAANWATRYGCFNEDLPRLKDWIVDKEGKRLTAFDEFWQIAAEMPDRALRTDDELTEDDKKRWMTIFGPCYTPPAKLKPPAILKKNDEWTQWNRRMVFFSFAAMEDRAPGTIAMWRKRTRKQEAMVVKLVAGFIPLVNNPDLPEDTGIFMMGENNQAHQETLTHFCMHKYCVTNVEYELFDPRHKEQRWDGVHRAVKETGDKSADDHCPVVVISWYDAVCYARWLGVFENKKTGRRYEITLPLEAQWEYTCRAGRDARFTFDGSRSLEVCTPEYCNYDGNYPDKGQEKGEYRGCTVPVDGQIPRAWSAAFEINPVKGRNRWGLYQMHGNVWEWCRDWYDIRASARVLRGGSWVDDGWSCRSAYRDWDELRNRFLYFGFRLAAVPCVVGAKQGKQSVGDAAARAVES